MVQDRTDRTASPPARFRGCLEGKTPEFCRIMAEEFGASQLWAQFNVGVSANLLREALTTQIKGETIPTDKPGALSMTLRQPVETVLSIVPWNGPEIWGLALSRIR
jgi:acyl-CoA reductase-like NAD-dependent aldehyde dehydrogenase